MRDAYPISAGMMPYATILERFGSMALPNAAWRCRSAARPAGVRGSIRQFGRDGYRPAAPAVAVAQGAKRRIRAHSLDGASCLSTARRGAFSTGRTALLWRGPVERAGVAVFGDPGVRMRGDNCYVAGSTRGCTAVG